MDNGSVLIRVREKCAPLQWPGPTRALLAGACRVSRRCSGTWPSTPGRIRTADPQFRKLLLYPSELRGPDGPAISWRSPLPVKGYPPKDAGAAVPGVLVALTRGPDPEVRRIAEDGVHAWEG